MSIYSLLMLVSIFIDNDKKRGHFDLTVSYLGMISYLSTFSSWKKGSWLDSILSFHTEKEKEWKIKLKFLCVIGSAEWNDKSGDLLVWKKLWIIKKKRMSCWYLLLINNYWMLVIRKVWFIQIVLWFIHMFIELIFRWLPKDIK